MNGVSRYFSANRDYPHGLQDTPRAVPGKYSQQYQSNILLVSILCAKTNFRLRPEAEKEYNYLQISKTSTDMEELLTQKLSRRLIA